MGRRSGVAARFLVNRDFARLWSGQALSTVGDFVFDITLTLWIATELFAHSRWAPAAVSGLMLCAVVAIIVVGPVAGVFVDRWDHRRVMLSSEIIRGVLVAIVAGLTFLPISTLPTWLWLATLYTTVFVVNSCGQFFNPARFAVIGRIVTGEVDQTKAFGLSQATVSTAAVIGPPLAAPLLYALGVEWAILLNAASYFVSFLAIRTVNIPPSPSTSAPEGAEAGLRHEFAAGLRLFRRNRYLKSLLAVAMIASLGTGALTPMLVFFLQHNLSTAASNLGILTACFGAGSVMGALASGRFASWVGARALTWMGLLASGLLLAAFARQDTFVVACVVLFMVGVPVAALNAGLSPQLLAVTPPAFRGRMMGVMTPANTAASMVSMLLAGLLASTALDGFHRDLGWVHLGPIDTILTGSAILIVLAGLLGMLTLPPTAAGDLDQSDKATEVTPQTPTGS